MTNKEEFEKTLQDFTAKHLTGSSGLVRKIGAHFYEARQPEIDSLKSDLEFRTMAFDAAHHICEDRQKEIDALKEEVARMRKGLPMTHEAVIAFVGHNFNTMRPVGTDNKPYGDLSRVRYSLTTHDLLSAFQDLDAAMKEMK